MIDLLATTNKWRGVGGMRIKNKRRSERRVGDQDAFKGAREGAGYNVGNPSLEALVRKWKPITKWG